MFLLVVFALPALTRLGCALLERADREGLLRRVRLRRRGRAELSLVRSVVELLTQGNDLWQLPEHQQRLNLGAGL